MADAGDKKRRLPILQASEAETPEQEADEERPPWHWSGFGVVAVFLAWLPLAMLVNGPIAAALFTGGAPDAPPSIAVFAANAAAFMIATFAAGVFVGRFGAQAGAKEAGVAGAAAAGLAWCLAAYGASGRVLLTLAIALPVLAIVGAASAYAGGRVGVKMRR